MSRTLRRVKDGSVNRSVRKAEFKSLPKSLQNSLRTSQRNRHIATSRSNVVLTSRSRSVLNPRRKSSMFKRKSAAKIDNNIDMLIEQGRRDDIISFGHALLDKIEKKVEKLEKIVKYFKRQNYLKYVNNFKEDDMLDKLRLAPSKFTTYWLEFHNLFQRKSHQIEKVIGKKLLHQVFARRDALDNRVQHAAAVYYERTFGRQYVYLNGGFDIEQDVNLKLEF